MGCRQVSSNPHAGVNNFFFSSARHARREDVLVLRSSNTVAEMEATVDYVRSWCEARASGGAAEGGAEAGRAAAAADAQALGGGLAQGGGRQR